MVDVSSLGSINVDLVEYLDAAAIEELEAAYDWFPRAGQTVGIEHLPAEIERRSFATFLGGKGANQALAAGRAGAETAFLGKVGADHEEYDLLAALEHDGVAVGGVGRDDGPTGRAYIFVDETGENRIAVLPGANRAVDEAYARGHLDAIAGADCLLLQNEIPAAPMAAVLEKLDDQPAAERPTVIFDPAPAEGAAPLLAHGCVDIITPNEAEYDALSAHLEAFDGVVIRTREEQDVIVSDGVRFRSTPPSVTPVDTTAAGDVFNGFLAARLAAGDGLQAAVEMATTAASMSTESEGAQSSIPTLDELRAFATGRR